MAKGILKLVLGKSPLDTQKKDYPLKYTITSTKPKGWYFFKEGLQNILSKKEMTENVWATAVQQFSRHKFAESTDVLYVTFSVTKTLMRMQKT